VTISQDLSIKQYNYYYVCKKMTEIDYFVCCIGNNSLSYLLKLIDPELIKECFFGNKFHSSFQRKSKCMHYYVNSMSCISLFCINV
jgi:hypothetical protein